MFYCHKQCCNFVTFKTGMLIAAVGKTHKGFFFFLLVIRTSFKSRLWSNEKLFII